MGTPNERNNQEVELQEEEPTTSCSSGFIHAISRRWGRTFHNGNNAQQPNEVYHRNHNLQNVTESIALACARPMPMQIDVSVSSVDLSRDQRIESTLNELMFSPATYPEGTDGMAPNTGASNKENNSEKSSDENTQSETPTDEVNSERGGDCKGEQPPKGGNRDQEPDDGNGSNGGNGLSVGLSTDEGKQDEGSDSDNRRQRSSDGKHGQQRSAGNYKQRRKFEKQSGKTPQHAGENAETSESSGTAETTPRSTPTSSRSRLSISSSMQRMMHHFSSSALSVRSLSCSSTPLRCMRNERSKSSSAAKGNSKPTTTKPEPKKQQSILRPPTEFVYIKGISGLHLRVPRYQLSCSYRMNVA